MRAQSGFTLVELIIVVAVAGIIMTLATLNFRQLNEKSRVESSVKEIYSALMRARNDAAATNTQVTVQLQPKQVIIGTITMDYPQFTINCNNIPCVVPTNNINFDRRGLTTNGQTIQITGYSPNTNPALDCIVITDTRINYGKWTGGNCVQR